MSQSTEVTRHQLWATFSVKDHCRRGAFIAEVLLYDKLLIPIVPTEKDGLSREEADREWQRWKANAWHPTRQTDILKILKERAEPIPWTAERQEEWREAMKESFADARRDGYFKTDTVLGQFAPAMARTVIAVSPVYSLAELRTITPVRPLAPHVKVPEYALLAVLGQELLVPSLQDGGYLKALEKAVRVAENDEYRCCRQALYDWQQRFISSNAMTDARSIEAAVDDEMRRLVAKVRTATKEQAMGGLSGGHKSGSVRAGGGQLPPATRHAVARSWHISIRSPTEISEGPHFSVVTETGHGEDKQA